MQPRGDHAATQQRAGLLAAGLPRSRTRSTTGPARVRDGPSARRPTKTYGSLRTLTDKSSTLTTLLRTRITQPT
eukprot:1519071-Prorocentrum_lima.AAC.1